MDDKSWNKGFQYICHVLKHGGIIDTLQDFVCMVQELFTVKDGDIVVLDIF